MKNLIILYTKRKVNIQIIKVKIVKITLFVTYNLTKTCHINRDSPAKKLFAFINNCMFGITFASLVHSVAREKNHSWFVERERSLINELRVLSFPTPGI